MGNSQKATIYIDVEDEITSIIDKVESSNSKIIALVLPKRAPVLQSVVNMKLLKKAIDNSKKNVVLVTSDQSIMPLAGVCKIYVAKTLASKPEIPDVVKVNTEVEDITLEEQLGNDQSDDADEEVQINQSEIEQPDDDKKSKKSKKSKPDKSLRVPSFEKFRLRIFLGIGLLIFLIIGWVVANRILPKATVTITTTSSTLKGNLNLKTDAKLESPNLSDKIIPIQSKSDKKTAVEKFSATGSKDLGTKASGTITVTNCTASAVTIPAGTAYSAGNLNFISQDALSLGDGNFTGGGVCKTTGTHVGNVKVTAQSAGDNYNLGARSYVIAGVDAKVVGQGTDMKGGTSKIVKVVTESDIETAKSKLSQSNSDEIKSSLIKELSNQGFTALEETFTVNMGEPTVTPEAETEAESGQVTLEFSYNIFGYKADHINKFIAAELSTKVNQDLEQIIDDGAAKAKVAITKTASGEISNMAMSFEAKIAPKIDNNNIAESIKGLKISEASTLLKKRPGVNEVNVELGPFWVSKVPKNTSKITIETKDASTAE